MQRNAVAGILFSTVLAVWGSGSVAAEAPADRVLLNGNVLTVDAQDSVAEAIAIRDGRIVAVGATAEIEALAGPDTDRIDALYRVHYLQWTGHETVDRVLAVLGLVGLAALSGLGALLLLPAIALICRPKFLEPTGEL